MGVKSQYEYRLQFADRLSTMMIKKNMDFEELCLTAHIRASVLEDYLTARRSPKPYDITKLARALDCFSSDLYRPGKIE